jgi:hypothetical protein
MKRRKPIINRLNRRDFLAMMGMTTTELLALGSISVPTAAQEPRSSTSQTRRIAAGGENFVRSRRHELDVAWLQTPIYDVEGDAFVRQNGKRYCNRPLYCNHIHAVALGGDKPYAMLISRDSFLGNLMFALIRDGHGKWLQDASDITSRYRPGRMEWTVQDKTWDSTSIQLELVPAAQGTGMSARVRVSHARPGDQLLWASGGVKSGQYLLDSMDMMNQEVEYMLQGFKPEDCKDNSIRIDGRTWTIQDPRGGSAAKMTGACSAPTMTVIADAGVWVDPFALLNSQGKMQPMACGTVSIHDNPEVYWVMRGPKEVVDQEGITWVWPSSEELASLKYAAQEFAAGMQRVVNLQNSVVANTPDPWLNAAVGAAVNAIDACYRAKMYIHGGMLWSIPLLGWRTLCGATAFGFHENVKADATLCIRHQIKQSPYTAPRADPKTSLSLQAPDSRVFGKGRVDYAHPHYYDMQSQFFDQVAHAWRWTGDPELERALRPSLDLHCEYLKECFIRTAAAYTKAMRTPGPRTISGITAEGLLRRRPTLTA